MITSSVASVIYYARVRLSERFWSLEFVDGFFFIVVLEEEVQRTIYIQYMVRMVL